jgi:arylformamidase
MARKIDLTFTIEEGMTTFPTHWHPFVEISQLGRLGIEKRETRKLVLGTHTGTHVDAPRHFIPGGATIDNVSLDVLMGPARVADFSKAGPFQEIGIGEFERALGPARPERVVMRFDWSTNWGSLNYYSDHPFISQDAARWLVDRGVRLLAMDTPMPDNPKHGRGNDPDSPNHKILLGNGVVLCEYLTNVKSISKPEIELLVAPLKILGADGAPARVVALEA